MKSRLALRTIENRASLVDLRHGFVCQSTAAGRRISNLLPKLARANNGQPGWEVVLPSLDAEQETLLAVHR